MSTLIGKISTGTYVPPYEETDPTVPEHVKAITQEQIEKWDNGTGEGTGSVVEEQDPTVPQYVKDITEEQINNWNNPKVITKTSELENDSGFITDYTETDPSVPSHVKNITTEDIAKWNSNTGGGNTTNYELPIASSTTLGGVKIGANLSIDENGVLSANSIITEDGTIDLSGYATKEEVQNITKGETVLDGPPVKAGYKYSGKDVYMVKHKQSLAKLTTSNSYVDQNITNIDVSKIMIIGLQGCAYAYLDTSPYFLPLPNKNLEIRYFYNSTKQESGFFIMSDKSDFSMYVAEWEIYFIYRDEE